MHEWKPTWTKYLLEKFENTKYLQKIKIAPVQTEVCPIDAEAFASFLGILYSSPTPLRTSDEDRNLIQSIPSFSLVELEKASKNMSNLRSADVDGIVVEMIKHADTPFKESLLHFFNQI